MAPRPLGYQLRVNTPPPACRTPYRRRPSTARAPDTRRAQLKRLHHPPKLLFAGAGSRHAESAGGNQRQSGRAAQPGRSRLPDLAPEPWQDTRHPARSNAGRVGPDRLPSAPSITLCRSSVLDSIGNIRHLLDIDALSRSATARRWHRTNEHPGHMGCWRGEKPGHSTYIVCLQQDASPARCAISARYETGARIHRASRSCTNAKWSQAVRVTIDKLS